MEGIRRESRAERDDSEEIKREHVKSTSESEKEEEEEEESLKKDKELLKQQQKDLAQTNYTKDKGNQLFVAGKFEDALAMYELALYFAPEIPSSVEVRSVCHSNRAVCFLKQKKYEEAIKECTKALEINAKNVRALIQRGEAHEKLKYFDEAIADMKKTMELDPSNEQARKSIQLLEPLAAEKSEKMMPEMQGSFTSMESSRLIEVRNWEGLNKGCLINIFGRVGLECLILDVPFVCKSWYKVSHDPHCYKVLDFQFMSLKRSPWAITVLQKKPYELRDANFPIAATPSPQFMKIAVNRSGGLATEVVFHTCLLRDNILEYILGRCPALKILTLPEWKGYAISGRGDYALRENDQCLLKMMSKLPNLESLITLNIELNNLRRVDLDVPNFECH
ncbi:hypothetical protein AQUCO_02700240v1 [Aquilegia coerulea]|uniref:Uncharacterized protein n=1 Tax=Aquilegia coerulea TaxID=218851 RepID=A0A2G5D5Y9_AQUCA|nr:hypothetical protein AQUCO_02700240v1 [Aquilegia coerulea]